MSNLVLQCKDSGDFKPHPEGVHAAVCVDCIDLGLVETEFQGEKRMTNKVRLVFESEQKTDDGRNCTIAKSFTASLHPKAKLAEFLGKWRGRPIAIGESIELAKLVGASCTIVVSHQQNLVGKTYASIDAVSKPTRKVVPSGTYDPAAARQRIAEWQAKQAASRAVPARPVAAAAHTSPRPSPQSGEGVGLNTFGETPKAAGGTSALPLPKSLAPVAAPLATSAPAADDIPFDPEVGF